jgi:hypothetical protein
MNFAQFSLSIFPSTENYSNQEVNIAFTFSHKVLSSFVKGASDIAGTDFRSTVILSLFLNLISPIVLLLSLSRS